MKKIGVFSFTCCEGCVIVFLETLNKKYFEWKKKMKIVNARVLKKSNRINEMDIAFVEGAISTESEVRKLKEIRAKAGVLVALGSGAVCGAPSNQRNKFSAAKKAGIKDKIEKMHQLPKILSVGDVVKVDEKINGCPVDEGVLVRKIEGFLGL